MKVFLTQLRFIVLLIALGLPSVSVFAQTPKGSERIEGSLADQNYYNIPQNVSTLKWFEELVLVLKQELAVHPEYGSKTQLLLGDAYHWIGHIYEDRGEYELAWKAHNRSYGHYILSSIRTSPAINNLGTVAHARFHLSRLTHKLDRPMPLGISQEPQVTDRVPSTDEEMKAYRLEIENTWNRIRPHASMHSCGRFFENLF